MKPKIIVTRNIPVEVESKLKEYFQVSFNREDKVFSKDTLRKAMENADGIVCTVTDNITNDLLSTTNKKVKIIANIGVGVDHIDLQSARENNVIITNTPDVLTEATVDVATLLLLSVTRNAFLVEKMLRQGECFDAVSQPANAKLFYEDVIKLYPKTKAAKEAKKKLSK